MSSDDDSERAISRGDDDMTCMLDAAGTCVGVNGAFLEAFEIREEQLLGVHIGDPALGGILTALVEPSLGDALTGAGGSMQRWWDFPSLGFRYVRIRVEPRRDAAGHIEGASVQIRDLTDARLAQTALESSERRFDDFADVLSEGLWELDANLRFVYLSPRFEAIMGLPAEDVLGRRRTELFPGEDQSAPATRAHHLDLDRRRPFENYHFTRVLPDATQRNIRMRGVPIFDSSGRFLGYRGVASDVSAQHALASRMAQLASHDPLTGLVNRLEFLKRLERVVETAGINGSEHGLCYADVDRFRAINDRYGHAAGDQLLTELAALLGAQIRRRDTLARVASNAFAILMEHCSLARIEHVAESVRRAVGELHFVHFGEPIDFTVTIGVVPIDARSRSVDRVLRSADRACYAAKSAGGDRILVYGQPDRRAARERRRYKPETV